MVLSNGQLLYHTKTCAKILHIINAKQHALLHRYINQQATIFSAISDQQVDYRCGDQYIVNNTNSFQPTVALYLFLSDLSYQYSDRKSTRLNSSHVANSYAV